MATGFASFAAVVRSPLLNQVGQGDQVAALLSEWFGPPRVIELPDYSDNEEDFSCLSFEDGSPRFAVLVVPGGDDRSFVASLRDPAQARTHLRAFVESGGGYVGICAGMCISTLGYWDLEGWVPEDPAVRRERTFPNFLGLFPHEVQNLHEVRRVGLRWNPAISDEHPMRRGLPEDGALEGARYNDGNALPAEGAAYAEGTELLLSYSREEAWAGGGPGEDPGFCGSLVGKWASLAYVHPANPQAGRLVLDGWHPESVHTPHCHLWLRCAVEYAGQRTQELVEMGFKIGPNRVAVSTAPPRGDGEECATAS